MVSKLQEKLEGAQGEISRVTKLWNEALEKLKEYKNIAEIREHEINQKWSRYVDEARITMRMANFVHRIRRETREDASKDHDLAMDGLMTLSSRIEESDPVKDIVAKHKWMSEYVERLTAALREIRGQVGCEDLDRAWELAEHYIDDFSEALCDNISSRTQ